MKIVYTQNPLDTQVHLDEDEQQMFRLKIKLYLLEEAMSSASIYLDPSNASWTMPKSPRKPDGHTLESLVQEVRKDYLNLDYFYSDEKPTGLDKEVERLFGFLVDELTLPHLGDCVCYPMSCSKCHAEDILGVNTLGTFPGKHELAAIESAFARKYDEVTKEYDRPEVSIDEALQKLQSYELKILDKLSGHSERWKRGHQGAYKYLLAYKNEHFSSTNSLK